MAYLAHLAPRAETRVDGGQAAEEVGVAAAEGFGGLPAADVEGDVVGGLGGEGVAQLGGDLFDGHCWRLFRCVLLMILGC